MAQEQKNLARSPENAPLSCNAWPRNSALLLRRITIGLVALLPLVLLTARTLAGAATGSPGELKTLDGLVGQWMALRTTIAAEKSAWQECRDQWQKEITLLEKEADALKSERDEGDIFTTSVEKKRAEMLAKKQKFASELQKMRAVFDRAEADLRRWRERIPPGLMPTLASGFSALPATQKEADKLPPAKRAQTVAALYTQIETLQNRIHAISETLEAEGTRRQADAIYLGLARAFAVSPGNDWAAVGTPSDSGWNWVSSAKDAMLFRRAVNVLSRKEPAQLVVLPMQVVKELKPCEVLK